MRKTFRYRLYPTPAQERRLERQLEECRWLYNHLLAERRDAWEQRQETVRLHDQHATLPALKAERPSLAGVQSQAVQNVAVRLDRAFQAFFRRCKIGEKPRAVGYPRFRGTGRYDSLTFPQVPIQFLWSRMRIALDRCSRTTSPTPSNTPLTIRQSPCDCASVVGAHRCRSAMPALVCLLRSELASGIAFTVHLASKCGADLASDLAWACLSAR
jgi:hypothetical protein